jgi:hypothetical protein
MFIKQIATEGWERQNGHYFTAENQQHPVKPTVSKNSKKNFKKL